MGKSDKNRCKVAPTEPPLLMHILVVAFHHKKGSLVSMLKFVLFLFLFVYFR